jgi:hypothetical protein
MELNEIISWVLLSGLKFLAGAGALLIAFRILTSAIRDLVPQLMRAQAESLPSGTSSDGDIEPGRSWRPGETTDRCDRPRRRKQASRTTGARLRHVSRVVGARGLEPIEITSSPLGAAVGLRAG